MDYSGVIIEESLADALVLKKVRILNTKIESVTKKHKTPWLTQWTLHEVEVPAAEAQEIAEELSRALDPEHEWYADYKTDREHYIIYRGKIFHITDRSDNDQYAAATAYGISVGIPEYQVDFSPVVKTRER